MATAGKKISAVDIKELWYGEPSLVTEDLTGAALKTLIDGSSLKKVPNIHQDTWTIEEAEASQDSFKDQRNGLTYRRSAKSMGDVTSTGLSVNTIMRQKLTSWAVKYLKQATLGSVLVKAWKLICCWLL